MVFAVDRSMIANKPQYGRATDAAYNLIKSHGYTSPPIDPEQIAEDEGVHVVYAEFEGSDKDDVSGFFDLSSGTIYVNEDISDNRITFTIAHELAHYILHQEYIKSNNYVPMPRKNRYDGIKPVEETEADWFAASLLVPLYMLKKYEGIATPTELAKMFFVSEDVIENRLDLLRRHPWQARKRP